MQPTPPALQLASRLKQLRKQAQRLTQKKLADAFSAEESLAPATVSSWESLTSPKVPPRYRINAYARFFATPRSTLSKQPRLFSLNELNQDEKKVYERLNAELLELRNAVSGESPDAELIFTRSWLFRDGGLVTIVCAQLPNEMIGEFGDPDNRNYTELQTYADIDALVELFGHIRSENPMTTVHFKIPRDVKRDDLIGHVVLLGGVVWNDVAGRLSEMAKIPIRQVDDPPLEFGEIFVADVEGREKQFWPKLTDADGKKVLTEDIGLLARVPNPLNSSRTLTICTGIHSRGVYGAVRTLTDLEMREANEKYIATSFGRATSFAILMSVKVIENEAMTPDFNSPGVVLHKWAEGAARSAPAPAATQPAHRRSYP
jgi:transcriptional regulator with XRE-family HTH domain